MFCLFSKICGRKKKKYSHTQNGIIRKYTYRFTELVLCVAFMRYKNMYKLDSKGRFFVEFSWILWLGFCYHIIFLVVVVVVGRCRSMENHIILLTSVSWCVSIKMYVRCYILSTIFIRKFSTTFRLSHLNILGFFFGDGRRVHCVLLDIFS